MSDRAGIGGIGSRYQIKRAGKVVSEADDPVTAQAIAKAAKRVQTTKHVSIHDRVTRTDEPIG
jgi:hypothetical protein